MPKAAMTGDEQLAAQLEDRQRRFQLLEGERKATYQTAELNIAQNKEIIKQMKEETKSLKTQITQLRNEKPQSTDGQLGAKMTDVQRKQKTMDLLHHEAEKKKLHLHDLEGKLYELSMDSKLPKTEDSPQMRHIRVLENRLDKSMIKYNEAQSIRKTYEAIVKRLTSERLMFDNQLQAIEKTLKSKERQYEELLLLSHDAYHAKEMAQAELHRFEQGVMEERNQRDKEVQEKKLLVQQRVEMNHRLEDREKMLKKQQELDKQGERQRQEQDKLPSQGVCEADLQAEESQKSLDTYEMAWKLVKEATGVDDVNEVIQKKLCQDETGKNLNILKDANRNKIQKLTEARRNLKRQVDDLKFSSGGTGGRRQQTDDLEKALVEANEKFERNRAKFERIAKILIGLKSGVEHLSDKLAGVKIDGENTVKVTDDTLEDVLLECSLKISRLMAKTNAMEDLGDIDEEAYEEKLLTRSQNDVRVRLDQDQDGDDDDDDLDDDGDDDVFSRINIRHNAKRILEQEAAKLKRKQKGKK